MDHPDGQQERHVRRRDDHPFSQGGELRGQAARVRRAGVPADRVVVIRNFILCSVLAGLVGVLEAVRAYQSRRSRTPG